MKLTKTANTKIKPGMTLIEITVVILVLLTLISVLFIGANIYKKGADRAACILNIRNVHQAVRANQNLKGLNTGAALDMTKIYNQGASQDGSTPAVENYLAEPSCPTDEGAYTAETLYPPVGTPAVVCSTNGNGVVDGDNNPIGTQDHFPESTNGW